MTTKNFLKALQLHCMQFGCPELIVSDSGSNLTAGSNILKDFLKDKETQMYLSENNMKPLDFMQYPRGCSELGGVVESCVKLSKRLIHGAIRNNVLDYFDFTFLIQQVVHLLNRRPLVFKEALRDGTTSELPSPITAEMLLKGHELISLNLIPELHDQNNDEDFVPISDRKHLDESFRKLSKCRQNLIRLYNENFLSNLFDQGCDQKLRYAPTRHEKPKIGDIILLKEPLLKPSNYPMALIRDVIENDLGEVTSVICLKGKTKEIVRRHVTSIIPLLSNKESPNYIDVKCKDRDVRDPVSRPFRKAANRCREKLKNLDY